MAHVIIRGGDGRRHEVEFDDTGITVSVHAGADVVELAIEARDDERASDRRRFAIVNIPRHLFGAAIAELARRDGERTRAVE